MVRNLDYPSDRLKLFLLQLSNEKNEQVVNALSIAISSGTRFSLNQFLPTETKAEFDKDVATFFF
jgi:hypothetical protein